MIKIQISKNTGKVIYFDDKNKVRKEVILSAEIPLKELEKKIKDGKL